MTQKYDASSSVVRRLPRYYRLLGELERNGQVRTSSRELGRRLGMTASQIRQDLCCFGCFGQQGSGYSVAELRENLQKIIANKQILFQRAFRTDSTEIEITEEKINFTWFLYTADGDEIAAYTQFISRLCDMARDAKRVSSKSTETDNDKYTFRCFLLRLGFIGKEYKTARKILLRNLTGNSAFRCGE